MSKIHTVTWVIEVDAETPEEAAREALNIMQDQESTATCFTVDDKQGNVTDIDLSPDCFDGRFFKWDGYVLDTVIQDEYYDTLLTRDGHDLAYFELPMAPEYFNNQEKYLNDLLQQAKNWIKNHQE